MSRERDNVFTSFISLAEHLDNTIKETEARNLIEKNIFPELEKIAAILARAASKTTRKGELRLALRMIGMLVVREIRNTGYNIEDTRDKRKNASEFEKVQVGKDFSRRGNIFEVKNYDVTYPNEKAEDMKREFEKRFRELYGLNIELNSPPKR